MRKSRIVIKGIEGETCEILLEKPVRFFDMLDELQVRIPDWATTAYLIVEEKNSSLEIALFEDAKAFFSYYTRKTMEDGITYAQCFGIDEVMNVWRPFTPPTLIGPNLDTVLR